MIEVDARGLSCPIPVVKTRKAMSDNPNQPITVLVESEVSRENVTRLARGQGYNVSVERGEDSFRLSLTPRPDVSERD